MNNNTRAFTINSSALSDRGLNERRPLNEDSFLSDAERFIFAVADGVGGAEAGEVASQTAIEVLDEAFRHRVDGSDVEDLMELAIQRANASIHQMAQEHVRFSMMATTIVAMHLKGNVATIGHVGDSRLYRLTPDGTLHRETEDHSVVEEEVRAGRMTPEQAANHPSKNVISRALGAEDSKNVVILRDPTKINEESDAVFYFPGCGSERLFSQIGLATLTMLYDVGAQTVLPPGYLCCGYPQTSSGDEVKGNQISTDNQVLFHRVANTLNYLDIKTVLVSCGTCMDQLLRYQFEKIFPGCRLLDIHEYLMEKGVALSGVKGVQYLYHDPCHTPMKTHQPLKVAATLMGQDVKLSDRCCGESGTFAVSRPDIATQVRFRKEEELHNDIAKLTGEPQVRDDNVKILTSCPSCQQGLARYADSTGLDTDYIVVELAKHRFGETWSRDFIDKVKNGGVERVLL